MITIKTPPVDVYYVVQMFSDVQGDWLDTMADHLAEADAPRALGHWRAIHPLRPFRLVKRTVTDVVIDI